MTEQRQEVFRIANDLFCNEPDWVTFFREVLGLEGIIRRVYKDPQDLSQFEQSDEYLRIQQMLAKLREKGSETNGSPKEPTRVITVRIPKSLHETLKVEAHEKHTSMNKLCISKLLQMVDDELVPAEAGAVEAAVA